MNVKTKRLWIIANTVIKLGLFNALRVFLYRVQKSFGMLHFAVSKEMPKGTVFETTTLLNSKLKFTQNIFDWFPREYTLPPRWDVSPFHEDVDTDLSLSWEYSIASLPEGVDVKEFWELSRFYWVPEFALAGVQGRSEAVCHLNLWLCDWIDNNPAYFGINWSCGQEASIRLLNLAMASILLQSLDKTTPKLLWLVEIHLRRISPTLHYAIGQQNNHGLAEAAALFVGGSWLLIHSYSAFADSCVRRGRYWLKNRCTTLIQVDGSSSQYSTNYHRANLDVLCLVEIFRQKLGLKAFPPEYIDRVVSGSKWLFHFVQSENGDTPNFGANDGSHLFSPTRGEYRDYRPTVQLAAALFDQALAYINFEDFEDRLQIFKLEMPVKKWERLNSRNYPAGGTQVIRRKHSLLYFRFPKFRFRPGHADSLHLDLWINGINILRDSGTFSYSSNKSLSQYFSGVKSHNTVQFDGIEQMPFINRFLVGQWLKINWLVPCHEDGEQSTFGAGYRNSSGCTHRRTVSLRDGGLVVKDEILGFKTNAVLRWRLAPFKWMISNTTDDGVVLSSDNFVDSIKVRSSVQISRFEIVEGLESRYYFLKTAIPVLEIEVNQECTITTEIRWCNL